MERERNLESERERSQEERRGRREGEGGKVRERKDKVGLFVVWLVALRPCNTLAYLRDGSAHTFCHIPIEAADQAFYFTQSQYTNTRSTSPSADLAGHPLEYQCLSLWYNSTTLRKPASSTTPPSPDLEPAGEEEERPASQQLEARH